jgi:hypothetical protein
VIPLVFFDAGAEYAECGYVLEPVVKPQEAQPVVCPEVWRVEPIDAKRAWDAVVALSRGQ